MNVVTKIVAALKRQPEPNYSRDQKLIDHRYYRMQHMYRGARLMLQVQKNPTFFDQDELDSLISASGDEAIERYGIWESVRNERIWRCDCAGDHFLGFWAEYEEGDPIGYLTIDGDFGNVHGWKQKLRGMWRIARGFQHTWTSYTILNEAKFRDIIDGLRETGRKVGWTYCPVAIDDGDQKPRKEDIEHSFIPIIAEGAENCCLNLYLANGECAHQHAKEDDGAAKNAK